MLESKPIVGIFSRLNNQLKNCRNIVSTIVDLYLIVYHIGANYIIQFNHFGKAKLINFSAS